MHRARASVVPRRCQRSSAHRGRASRKHFLPLSPDLLLLLSKSVGVFDPRVDFISVIQVVVDAGFDMGCGDAEILSSIAGGIRTPRGLHDLRHIEARAGQRSAATAPTVTKHD